MLKVLSIAALLAAAATANLPSLPQLNLAKGTLTLSGFDSGAAFATQYQLAWSTTVRAVGVIAGIPYACAEGTVAGGTACMETPYLIELDALLTEAAGLAATKMIDPLVNVSSHYVAVGGVPSDLSVQHLATQKLVEMYGKLKVANVDTYFDFPKSARHAWLTSAFGNDCSYLGAPYVNNCNFDFAGTFLSKAFAFIGLPFKKGSAAPPPSMSHKKSPGAGRPPVNMSHFLTFNQSLYGGNPILNSMDTEAFLYVPEQCQSGRKQCHLHVHFHGCEQSRATVGGLTYVSKTQLNEHAERNNIVILYPQATPNALKFNPLGCWDWFGYNNDDFVLLEYASKHGMQIRIIRTMIDTLINGW